MNVNGLVNAMSVGNIKNAIDLSVAKLAKDSVKQSGSDLVNMMNQSAVKIERSVKPHLGGNIDICC